MTIRDPHDRDQPLPLRADDGTREPTQPLDLEPDEPVAGDPRRPATLSMPAPLRHEASVGAPATGTPGEDLGRVLGRYRLLELLGKGGMGYVFRAEHTRLGREVAIKLLRRELASRRDAVARFFQEARTVNLARHRNIVDVTDFVELDDGTAYIVMELLPGTSLSRWAAGGVELSRALAVLVQICDGLGAAHQVGVVHRDLKPDNIVIVPSETGELVKLVDFGVAKLVNHEDADLGWQTAAGAVIGTPAYMSPEQAGGLPIDARSDIYSLGAIMYELFSGQPMFHGRSFGDYVRKHLTEIPVRPRQTRGGAALDPRLEAVILRCLEKDPEQRFAATGPLREILGELRDELAQLAHPSNPSANPPAAAPRLPLAAAAALPPPSAATPSEGQPAPPRPAPEPATPAIPAATPRLAPAPAHVLPSSTPDGQPPDPHPPRSPLPPPALASSSATPVVEPPLTLEGDDRLSVRRSRRRSPLRWPWLAGATAVAVLGAAAVRQYSRHAALARSPTVDAAATDGRGAATVSARPSAEPPPLPARHPALIELRFDATPEGAVFTEGRSTELCRTPCAFDIDPADGASTRRGFVVRRPGYVDQPVVVDLNGVQRVFHVLLQPLPGPHTSGR